MVPVRVRDEYPRRQPLHFGRGEVIGQALDARAAVEDIQRLAADLHGDAGRVAAIAQRTGSRHRQRSVHAPVADRHFFGQDLGDQTRQRLALDRLDDVAVGAEFLGAAAVEIVGFRRAHDDLDRRQFRSAADLPAQFEAVHFRHDDVADDAVGPIDRNVAQRLAAGLVARHAVSGLLQHRLHQLQDDRVIVYDQKIHGPFLGCRSARRHGLRACVRRDDCSLEASYYMRCRCGNRLRRAPFALINRGKAGSLPVSLRDRRSGPTPRRQPTHATGIRPSCSRSGSQAGPRGRRCRCGGADGRMGHPRARNRAPDRSNRSCGSWPADPEQALGPVAASSAWTTSARC